jgi:ABC-type multidrug transport system fused ATPase/permease subunit
MLSRADIRTFKIESWRERIGVVFQEPILFAGTVHDNIAYGRPGATRLEVEEAARQANCDFIWDLPQGFDTMSEWGGVASCLGWIVRG